MVRETRHLWVGNLPENIREDRIREHFKRYGRVQSVKIFSRKGGGECEGNGLVGCGTTGICATVSFMDIKSAAKAHTSEHKLDEHLLTTEYHEPAPIPSAPPASAVPPSVSAGGSPVTQATPASLRHPPPYSSPRFTHGPTEDITTFDRSSHFYERRDGAENYVRRPASAYHVVSPSDSLRGRTRERDRLYRNGPPHYTPILESVVARTPPTHHRTVTTTGWNSFESTSCSRYPSSVVTTPEILSYQEERRESTPVIIVHKKHPKSRRKCRVMPRCGSNGSESVSNNSDSSRSRSHSSSSSSHSRSSSSSSDSSSAAISDRSCSTHSHHGSLKSTVTVHSTISTPLTNCSPVVHTDDRRPLAICVRNLPSRSSDSSLKDGLYHEYKKQGKVTSVKILGQGANRYAIVYFKKADDVEKALQMSHDKLFFGSKIEVTIYHGYDVEDNDIRSVEADLDEYHPKATRTLFIGNLEKDVSVNDLRSTFQKFGEIIDIDIRKQGSTCYAFCQYCDISSVVKAMHAMDGEYLGNNKINLGYGKSLATNCLWVAGVADCVTEKQLIGSFSQFGHVTHVDINRSQRKALVFFQQTTHAQAALSQMRGYNLKNRRLMADYASLECQDNFYEHYEKSKSVISTYENNCQDSPRSTGSTRGLDTPVSSTSSNSGNVSKHSMSSITNSNNSSNSSSSSNINNVNNNSNNSNNNNNNNNSNISGGSSNKISRVQHSICPSRTTPTHQPLQHTPSSNSASPIVNNTPSPSPSTSSRSTPRPQQTSRFDYTSALENSADRRTPRSLEDLNVNNENNEKSPNPQDDVTLQKERVSLLEQLNDYSSSEDEEEEEELTSIKQQNTLRQQRSTSREESRPGTPLCDERPENILAHYESRRAAKEKSTNNAPLSLPLPSFANKVPRSISPTERISKSPHLIKPLNSRSTESSRNSLTYTRQSPSSHVKDKPSILDSKLSSITSFDSLTETSKVSWIEQLKSLDEKYEKWTGSRSKVLTGKLDTSAVQTKHKLLDVNSIGRQRSEICQTVLSRKSVFDDHFKRLETITDQPSSSDFISPRVNVNNSCRSHSLISAAVATLPNLCSKPISLLNNVSSSSSASSSPSPSAIKGLQYPFPSHPPIKTTLSKINTSFVPSKAFSDSLPTNTTLIHASNPRTSLLLKNNSVEKLTDLPKTTSFVTSRDSLNRLDITCAESKKELSSPISSRRNSIESIGRKLVSDEECAGKENKRLPDLKVPIVNHIDVKTKFNNAAEWSKLLSPEKENSVLDKRKTSLDKSSLECSNAVSVIFHTSQRDKLSKSLEDVSEIIKFNNNRRSSIESEIEDDEINTTKYTDTSRINEKKPTDTLNHTKVKISDTRPDVTKIQKSDSIRYEGKSSKSMLNCDDEETISNKTVPYNHVDDIKDLDKKKDEIKKIHVFGKKEDELDEPKCRIEDEDDDDSNDVDDNKTTTVKNKIIETVFHIKHEKKKQADSKTELTDDKIKISERKKISTEMLNKSKDHDVKKDSQNNIESKVKKECIKTKEFNMFENKVIEKKKNHFLLESWKSFEADSKDEIQKNNKCKDKEMKENESIEQISDKTKIEKKKEKHLDIKYNKDASEKRKSEEKKDETKFSAIELEKCKSEEKYAEKKHELHKSEQKKEVLIKLKDPDKDVILREKKKEKISGQPENGKIKHHEFKKCKEIQENYKQKLNVEKEVKTDTADNEKNSEIKSSFHKNRFSLDILKQFNPQEISKERKNSSGSSSLSDSVHSKSKLSSFDSMESNSEEKLRHDSLDNDTHILKKFDKHKYNSAADTNSGKEERKSDSSRNKKLEKSGNPSRKTKKSKKRKTLSDTSSDSEFESYDESKSNKKNHSIFDVVLDEPAYISMYDKVKARSTKNLQKQEEEKRQEKLKEKFNQLKQSRVKREEKKRSTSYDDDTDQERAVSRKANKLILDSSDEHSDNDKVNMRVPSDTSDDESQSKKLNSDCENDIKTKFTKAARRSLNPKIKEKLKYSLTDTSEDEMKLKQKREQHFAIMNENKRKFKKGTSKKISARPSNRHKREQKKTESDISDDEKVNIEKSKPYFQTNKINVDKIYSDFSEDDLKSKSNKIQSNDKFYRKLEMDKCEDGYMRKTKPKNDLKAMIEKGELNLVNNFHINDDKNKIKLLISDISEEEEMRPNLTEKSKIKLSDFGDESREKFEKLLSDTSENESIASCRFPSKKCNIYSEESEADHTIKQENKNDELFYNLAELHHDYVKSENSSPPPLIDPMVYDINDFQKKKSHKKKQKRQKSREHSIEHNKKHSKKERRKSILSDIGDEECKEKEHKTKPKKKKKNRNKIKSVENLEEDIFGSMSDESDKLNETAKLSKLSVSDVYDADSDSSNKDIHEAEQNSTNQLKFSKSNSELEAKILNSIDKTSTYDNYFEHMKSKKKKRKKSKEEKSSRHHHHHHHHHHNHHIKQNDSMVEKVDIFSFYSLPCLVESTTPLPDKLGDLEVQDTKEETKEENIINIKECKTHKEAVDIVTSSIAECINEEIKESKTGTAAVTDLHENSINVIKNISCSSEEELKENIDDRAVKSIADGVTHESIHERAVLSLSTTLVKSTLDTENKVRPSEEKLKANVVVDAKIDITISQEETEDAVAAILGDPTDYGFTSCFPDDAMKPDTPSSEPDLQIDTDNEDTSTILNKDNVENVQNEEHATSSDESFVSTNDCKVVASLDEEPFINSPSPFKNKSQIEDENHCTDDSTFITNIDRSSELQSVPKDLNSENNELHVASESSSTETNSLQNNSLKIVLLDKEKQIETNQEESKKKENLHSFLINNNNHNYDEPCKHLEKPKTSDVTEHKVINIDESHDLKLTEYALSSINSLTNVKKEENPEKQTVHDENEKLFNQQIEEEINCTDYINEKFLNNENKIHIAHSKSPHTVNNVENFEHIPYKLKEKFIPLNNFLKHEDLRQSYPFKISSGDNLAVSDVVSNNEIKNNNRKRSLTECNGPTLINIQEKDKLRFHEEQDKPKFYEKTDVIIPESEKFENKKNETDEVNSLKPISDKIPTLLNDGNFSYAETKSNSFNKQTSLSSDIRQVNDQVDSKTLLSDHTYNSIILKQSSTISNECHEKREISDDKAHKTVILERSLEPKFNKILESDESFKPTTFESTTVFNTDKVDRIESDVALKQKLQIPAQQNTEISDCKELERNNTEVNEANKENIVKTILNQENITEVSDDSKLNVIVKNKEITRSVEEEIFKGVSNDFPKCNHRLPENNRNILEKVVQRIHESKRIIQKSSEDLVSTNVNLTPLNLNDKVALATEEDITSAEILLKISESSIIKNQISDYNCIIKSNEEKETIESDCKDLSFETEKNDSFSSVEFHQESNEETFETTDEMNANDNMGTKLTDHSYNAKRGRRRKATVPGGMVTRRGKQNIALKETEIVTNYKLKKSTADVYEFKEDSEDEVKRPRLILTIKSPIEQVQPVITTVPNTLVVTESKSTSPVNSNTNPVPVTPKSASAHTRKSRRLQEKEGVPRNTVDDTIDEVVKTVQSSRPTRRTTRIAAAAAAAIITTVHESTRKNARGTRKTPTKSEINVAPSVVENQTNVFTEEEEDDDDFPPSPVTTFVPSTSPSTIIPSSPVPARISTEPTNLIDPVSGLLIPMKEAEEGQYVPVLTELNQLQKTSDSPPEKKARWDENVEESALSLVKSEPSAKIMNIDCTITTSVITATVTSVIASTPVTPPVNTLPLVQLVATTVAEVSIPITHNIQSNAPVEEDEPISLIKTTTASIITPAAVKSNTAHSVSYSQSFSSVAYTPSQPAKLHSSKIITPQPRILAPITPKAHIMQALNSENDNQSSDEVSYPPQYSSPLLHGTVASPPLVSPKISTQPNVTGANNTRVALNVKNIGPLEPLKIDPAAGFYFIQNTSPQSRPGLSVQSPSPQARVVHTSTLGSGLLPHAAVQSGHYIHPQFMYQPYIQEPSIASYHHIPPPSQSSSSTGNTKIIADRDIIDNRPPPPVLSIASSPPLELRKKGSPRPRLSDSPLITSPYVRSTRTYYYDEPLQPHRPLQSQIRVATPLYGSKVPSQSDPVDMFIPAQSRLHLETSRYTGHVPPRADGEDNVRYSHTDGNYGSLLVDSRVSSESELDYSKRKEIALCDGTVPRLRDSPASQMDSPPLGDSPPQGNLDGTVLVQMYPIIWQGLLALKNDQAAVQMHVVSGNTSVAYDALPKLQDGYQPLLRIAQRMRLEQAQLDGVHRKMEIKDEHCTILGLPCGKNQEDVLQQATNLESCIIPYLQQKKAAGIINTAAPGTQQAAFVVHVFPPCEFADNVLLNSAPDLFRKVQETSYLVCIIVTV